MIDWMTILALIIMGIVLIIIEIIFVPGTTVVGILGFMVGIYGVYESYEKFGTTTGHIVLVSSTVVAFIAIIYSFKSDAWKKFANTKSMNAKVNEGLTQSLSVADRGLTSSSLKPVGKALFEDKEYEVTSLGNFVEEKTEIEIIKIDKNKIIVKPIKL